MSQPRAEAPRIASISSPFPRVRKLLDHIRPARTAIDMTIGEPRHAMPEFLMAKLNEAHALYAKYPPIRGTDDLRLAMADWLGRRYGIARQVDPTRHVIPIVGSREGLFSAIFTAVDRRSFPAKPAVLIPNPFYQVYAGGTLAAGADPIYLPASRGTNFLPDLDALAKDKALLSRAAAFFLCSPANPQGTIAGRAYLLKAIELARAYDFMLFADECYSEVYTEAPPPGALEVAATTAKGFDNVVAFNSLSKRSNLPGLRTGLCAGDAKFLDQFTDFRNVTAPQMPLPVQHASAAIWREETHVEASRKGYVEKFEIADRVLGNRYGYRRPGGGFFLWLDVAHAGGGEKAAVTLWQEGGVKVVPGAYLARDVAGVPNPGTDFIRVALVHDAATTQEALERVVDVLR